MIPVWVLRYLLPAVAILGLVAIGFRAGMRWEAAKVAKAEAAVQRVTFERDSCHETLEAIRGHLAAVEANLAAAAAARDVAEADYQAAVARPPEVVVRYREHRVEVPATITPGPCPNQVAQMVGALQRAIAEGGAP